MHRSPTLLRYYVLILLYPVFFVLHKVNENFGLVPAPDIFRLLFIYLLGSAITALVCLGIITDRRKAFILTFVLLTFYLLFGSIKDFLSHFNFLEVVTRYSYFISILALLVVAATVYLKKTRKSFSRGYGYTSLLLVVLTGIEVILLGANVFTGRIADLGDPKHELIKDIRISPSLKKPDIFWIVMDEYPASSSLLHTWKMQNPLDSQLRNKGFFVADSATSPYNYTHFSLAATLDMQYLKGVTNGSFVDYRDMVSGEKSLSNNNVTELLTRNGYIFHNLSIFDMESHPALPYAKFNTEPSSLISNSTFTSRVRKDIWWIIFNLISNDPRATDKAIKKGLRMVADNQQQLIARAREVVDQSSKDATPSFYMFHYMITHDPYVFTKDGSFDENASTTGATGYEISVQYANKVLNDLTDRILSAQNGKDFIIVFQSDHGYRYEEHSPEFEKESSNIYYAVYCSDGNYPYWNNRVSSVNNFRILFNKYFKTGFPILPEQINILKYKQEK